MKEQQIRIAFQPQGRVVSVLRGTTILEAAARAGLVIETPCGGAGTCGKCRVQVTAKVNAPAPADERALSATELNEGWRLACQYRVEAPVTVHVPETSLFGTEHQILATAESTAPREVLPAIRKLYVEL